MQTDKRTSASLRSEITTAQTSHPDLSYYAMVLGRIDYRPAIQSFAAASPLFREYQQTNPQMKGTASATNTAAMTTTEPYTGPIIQSPGGAGIGGATGHDTGQSEQLQASIRFCRVWRYGERQLRPEGERG